MLRRNRCNKVFRARAKLTGDAVSNYQSTGDATARYDRFTSREWLYRRGLANYLGGWLLAVGRAASSLTIQLNGNVRDDGEFMTRTEAYPIVQVNGFRWVSRDAAVFSADPDDR